MPFEKGTTAWMSRKRVGRKSKAEEIKGIIGEITQDALIKLANSKVYKHLNEADDYLTVKEMGLPITLKGMIEKKDIQSGGKPIPLLGNYVQYHDGHKEGNSDEEAHQSDSGGDLSREDNLNNPVSDRPSTEGQEADNNVSSQ